MLSLVFYPITSLTYTEIKKHVHIQNQHCLFLMPIYNT
jgi:hypothetical protein